MPEAIISAKGTEAPTVRSGRFTRLKYLQRRMARQDRVNEARGGKTAKFVSKRRQKTLSRFNALQGRIVRRRNDWIEKTTTTLAKANILTPWRTWTSKP